MAFVKCMVLIGEDRHCANYVVIGHQRYAAEASTRTNGLDAQFLDLSRIIVADENWLPRPNYVLRKMIARRATALWHAHAVDQFQIEVQFIPERIQLCYVEVFDIE